jgi:uncharacterized protein
LLNCIRIPSRPYLSRLCVLLTCLTAAASLRATVDVDSLPKPTGYVNDLANVVNASDRQELEDFCGRVEQQLGVQFALVTVDSVGDRPVRDVALDMARKWGVGDRKSNQGVLLLLAVRDRKDDIETGRGIEPYITDGFAGGTLRAMRPDLRRGDYGAALIQAAHAMAEQIAEGKNLPFDEAMPQRRERTTTTRSHGFGAGWLWTLGILAVLWLLGRGGRG